MAKRNSFFKTRSAEKRSSFMDRNTVHRQSYLEALKHELMVGNERLNEFEVLRQGSLNKHIYLENGQKSEKSMKKWHYCYAILTENLLMTFKGIHTVRYNHIFVSSQLLEFLILKFDSSSLSIKI